MKRKKLNQSKFFFLERKETKDFDWYIFLCITCYARVCTFRLNFQKNYWSGKLMESKFFHVFLAAENESDNKIWHLAIFQELYFLLNIFFSKINIFRDIHKKANFCSFFQNADQNDGQVLNFIIRFVFSSQKYIEKFAAINFLSHVVLLKVYHLFFSLDFVYSGSHLECAILIFRKGPFFFKSRHLKQQFKPKTNPVSSSKFLTEGGSGK